MLNPEKMKEVRKNYFDLFNYPEYFNYSFMISLMRMATS